MAGEAGAEGNRLGGIEGTVLLEDDSDLEWLLASDATESLVVHD